MSSEINTNHGETERQGKTGFLEFSGINILICPAAIGITLFQTTVEAGADVLYIN